MATLFIQTESGGTDNINKDKNVKERCGIIAVDSLGLLQYKSNGNDCTIKGRGSSTWREEKKPYTIKLPKKKPFLGMASAKKWVLLANAFDESNLRNKVVYDFSRQLNMRFVPDSRYADVYINGCYNGLYLITEKVEYGKNRLHVEGADSVYLFHQSSMGQSAGMDNCFTTGNGQRIIVDYPKKFSKDAFLYMQSKIQELEGLIMDSNDSLAFLRNIDIDSWAYKFLIDDIFENTDCDFLSSYFYMTVANDTCRFYGGPIWDYDLSIGNNWANYQPDMFFARRVWKAKTEYTPWYGALYSKDYFRHRMREIYQSELRPKIEGLMSVGIDTLTQQIKQASYLNSMRWAYRFHVIQSERHSAITRTPQAMAAHLRKRLEIMDKIYGEATPYALVSYETTERGGGYFLYKAVPFNEKLVGLPSAESMGYNRITWMEKDSKRPFGFNSPLTHDVVLEIDHEKSDMSWKFWFKDLRRRMK